MKKEWLEFIQESLNVFAPGPYPSALETWNFFENLDDEELGTPAPMPSIFKRRYDAAIAEAQR